MSTQQSAIRNPQSAIAPVRVGMVGLGRMGLYHAQRLGLREDMTMFAVYDEASGVRELWRDSACHVHQSWAALIHDPQIEVVLIATPPETHAPLALEAIAAGKHVIVETPLCLTVKDADALSAAARNAGRMLSVAHLRRWEDDFRTARTALENGSLGRAMSIKYALWQYAPQAKGSGVFFSPRQDVPPTADQPVRTENDSRPRDGALWNVGIHLFDQLLQLVFGQPVRADLRLFHSAGDPKTDDGFLAVITFDDGIVSHIEVNHAAHAPLQTGWMIAGTEGAYANFTHYSATAEGEIVDVPLTPLATDWDQYYAAIVQHLRHGGPVPASAEEARRVIELMERLQAAVNR